MEFGPIMARWRGSLAGLLRFYDTHHDPLYLFYPCLFLFFVAVNVSCYWLAMFTAFPNLIVGENAYHYFLVQFPVGILGAVFDSLSFFITVYIVRRAIQTKRTSEYLAHLSIDLIIAVVATFWVLFVFSFSGWVIGFFSDNYESLAGRNWRYRQKLIQAVADPTGSLRNIYFGLIMGVSAMLPTCTHIGMFLTSTAREVRHSVKRDNQQPA